MARMENDGIDELITSLETMYGDTDKLQDDILDAGAAIVKREVERAIFRSGRVDTGELLNSIKIKKKNTSKNGYRERVRIIRPMGKDSKGVSNGYKGFVTNYGSSKMPGDRYWDRAEKAAEPEIESAANTEINLYLREKGLI